MYRAFVKRTLDFSFALLGLVLSMPVFLLLILLLAIANRGKVFFLQSRPGKHGRIFKVIKFRTMNDRRDARGKLLPNVDRITSIGRAVRASSLDEIPQLINVLRGDMSLVGPRPLLVQYLPLYSPEQARRHEVRPGITGWAQVNGRNAISWEQKFEYDVWYVDHVGFGLDCRIVGRTIRKVFTGEAVNAQSTITMEPFRGNSKNIL